MSVKKRRKFILDRAFQSRFVLHFIAVILANVLITLCCIYLLYTRSYNLLPDNTSVLVKIDTKNIVSLKKTKDQYIESLDGTPYLKIEKKPKLYNAFDLYLYPIIAVSILNSLALLFFSFFLSFKMAGPLYRLKKSLKNYINGDPVTEIQLRKRDQFSELASLISRALKHKESVNNEANEK